MGLREQFMEALKASMKSGDAATTSTIRMILAELKKVDIEARPRGVEKVEDAEILAMLRRMVKSRRESIEMYRQGGRQDLVDKEAAEIAVIERFLPPELEGEALEAAVRAAIGETGAASVKDMGKVMAALKAKHGGALDMAKAGPVVKAALGG
ncbi:GatB/YqeY domain-containing protein [Elioraea thermophila]|uniref:GatB/YqeY domain-containing protein n=1 Tax=Elioraea thermophila TaxID=2185104 RepID=UPI000DF12529|nr:GatB/YqeY domain-containing protein [Elioraea thermophila]